jgi:hypothetical protein
MIDLSEFCPDFQEILSLKVAAIARQPVSALGPLCEEASVYFRTAGIANLLVGYDSDGFHHMLTRSALTRLYLLEKTPPALKVTSRFCKLSRASGFFDALTADRADLARQIIAASPQQRNLDFEYEDDYAYTRFLHGLLLDATKEDQQRILDDWKGLLEDPSSAKFDVCVALLGCDSGAFDEAFANLLAVRTTELKAQERSLSRDEMEYAGGRYVYVEGLAILHLAEMFGIATQLEYKYCPKEARQPLTTPFPDNLYPGGII